MRFPTDQQHLTIIGRNGSGKTQAALWHLSNRPLSERPWIIVDFKRDDLVAGIPGLIEIPLKPISKAPASGLYVVRPHPDDSLEIEQFLMSIWNHGNIGVYTDEGYMMSTSTRPSRAYRAILTQGRSKWVPTITLSQRPNWMDRFIISESTFYQLFHLNSKRDMAVVQDFVDGDIFKRLPEYHSYYYDVNRNTLEHLHPVPKIETIYDAFERRLPRKKIA
jgi:hypothetical protein